MRPHGCADVEAAGGRGCVALIHSLLRSLEVCHFHDMLFTGWFLCHENLRCFHNVVSVNNQTRHALHAQLTPIRMFPTQGRSQTGGCWLHTPRHPWQC